jgi:hypothetical protein
MRYFVFHEGKAVRGVAAVTVQGQVIIYRHPTPLESAMLACSAIWLEPRGSSRRIHSPGILKTQGTGSGGILRMFGW